MSKINLLDSSIYNRIAAGEVVQQPSSVVKELLENSIDSGATEITLEIKEGGIKEICVKDNGYGMIEEDLKKAFLPHATSKIKSIDDLDSISTLGFRGEALASIASVSHVEAYSKTKNSELGTKISIRGGEFSDTEGFSCANGTSITVKNLFFNTPARAKFLRKPYQEESDVTTTLQKTAFANPFLSFSYIVDGKLIYKTSGDGLLGCIKSIYGLEFSDSCIPVEYTKSNVTVKGYVSKPTFTKPNRNYQTTIINGRFIKDFSLSASVANAYGERLMKRTFPIFVLEIIMPFEDVDVNVHPAKTEVRFKRPHEIYGAVYNATKNAISAYDSTFELGINSVIQAENNSYELPKNNENVEIFAKNTQNSHQNISIFDTFIQKAPTKEESFNQSSSVNFELIQKLLNSDKSKESQSQKQKENEQKTTIPKIQTNNVVDNVKILGQVFDCYIIVQSGENLVFIDQHAAHERLIYDELMEKTNAKDIVVQPLLLPYVRTFQPKEFERISDILGELSSLGFEIEEFGRCTIKVSAVPIVLSQIKFDEFFDGFLSDFDERGDFTYAELLKEKIASRACRYAIKAGDSLSSVEIYSIINKIIQTKTTLQCPHGRPIAIVYSKRDIEKLFKRIV